MVEDCIFRKYDILAWLYLWISSRLYFIKMEVDFSGIYTCAENCSENDIGVILSEGTMEEKESFKGDKYMQLNIDVEINGKKLIHSPRMAEGKNLVKAWGKDTKEWVGKKFKTHIINYKAMGQTKSCVEIEPLVEKA